MVGHDTDFHFHATGRGVLDRPSRTVFRSRPEIRAFDGVSRMVRERGHWPVFSTVSVDE